MFKGLQSGLQRPSKASAKFLDIGITRDLPIFAIPGFHMKSEKNKIKFLSFPLHQVKVIFRQISAGLSSAQ